jgi:hypothetical protein
MIYVIVPTLKKLGAGERLFLEFFKNSNYLIIPLSRVKDLDHTDIAVLTLADFPKVANKAKCKLVVFLCDLIRLGSLKTNAASVCAVITTSDLQSRIINSILNIPAFHIVEPLDPLYHSILFDRNLNNLGGGKRLVIFGYSNSIDRTSAHLRGVLSSWSKTLDVYVFSEAIPTSFRHLEGVKFRVFDEILSFSAKYFSYVILSSTTVDLSVATMAKSENKLISALQMNMLPIVSDDIKYLRHLPESYPYKFRDPDELKSVISKLDLEKDQDYLNEIRGVALANYTRRVDYSRREIAVALNSLAAGSCSRDYFDVNWPNVFSYGLRDSFNAFIQSVLFIFYRFIVRVRYIFDSD